MEPDYKSAFETMSYYYWNLVTDGTDDMDVAFKLMRKYGLIDEDGEWLGDEE